MNKPKAGDIVIDLHEVAGVRRGDLQASTTLAVVAYWKSRFQPRIERVRHASTRASSTHFETVFITPRDCPNVRFFEKLLKASAKEIITGTNPHARH